MDWKLTKLDKILKYQLNNLFKREFSSKSFYIPLGQASLKSIEYSNEFSTLLLWVLYNYIIGYIYFLFTKLL